MPLTAKDFFCFCEIFGYDFFLMARAIKTFSNSKDNIYRVRTDIENSRHTKLHKHITIILDMKHKELSDWMIANKEKFGEQNIWVS